MAKRSYNRRSEEDQIRELQAKVAELKALAEAKSRPDLPVVQEWPKTQKALRAFMAIAMKHRREDLAISAQAFMAGIERTLDPEISTGRGRRGRGSDHENDD